VTETICSDISRNKEEGVVQTVSVVFTDYIAAKQGLQSENYVI
jgi:hypothetical protein